jgi:serine/threonine protein kinase
MNINLASAFASRMDQRTEPSSSLVPIIHFGLIDLDLTGRFRSGGFSRVYQAEYRAQIVAVKVLFVMELTPESIIKFYKEAQVLKDLQHENIVECIGVTVIPPAIGVVMEYCKCGSLFDLLYVYQLEEFSSSRHSSVSFPSSSDLRLSQIFRTQSSTHKQSLIQNDESSFSDIARRKQVIAGQNLDIAKLRKSGLTPSAQSRQRLASILKARNEIQHTEIEMMLDATKAVAFIHSKGFMHCDIKSLNFLVTDVGLLFYLCNINPIIIEFETEA